MVLSCNSAKFYKNIESTEGNRPSVYNAWGSAHMLALHGKDNQLKTGYKMCSLLLRYNNTWMAMLPIPPEPPRTSTLQKNKQQLAILTCYKLFNTYIHI